MTTEVSTYALISTDQPIDIPRDVAICPICGKSLYIDAIEEYEIETQDGARVGKLVDTGFSFGCESEPDMDTDDFDKEAWDEWFKWHYSTPYIDWMPLQKPILEWFNQTYRIRLAQEE